MSAPLTKLYELPVSQPCRSVSWLLKLGNVPYESVMVDIFKGEHKTPEYLAKHPAGMVPMIETSCGVCAPESSAIMIYFCNTNNITEYYPKDEVTRLKINSALHAHGNLVRPTTMYAVYPFVGVIRSKGNAATRKDFVEAIEQVREKLKAALSKIDAFLKDRQYIAGTEKPTIADLLAICELNQLPLMSGIIPSEIATFTMYPNIKRYTELMAKVPYHDEMMIPFKDIIGIIPQA